MRAPRSREFRLEFVAMLLPLALAASAACADASPPPVLRVCADPNNLPFSNDRREGFENRIVERVARELGMQVRYTWWAQRRGYVRNTLGAHACDVLPGIAAGVDRVATTRPYYRSSYVFVVHARDGAPPSSFDDPALRRRRIGIPLVGDDGAGSPPALALARRGIVDGVRGFPVTSDYSRPTPPARLLDALARGEIDVAVAWGPLAGWYARTADQPLLLAAVGPPEDGPALPMSFAVAMGVRREDESLRLALDAALDRVRPEVDAILAEFGVPRL